MLAIKAVKMHGNQSATLRHGHATCFSIGLNLTQSDSMSTSITVLSLLALFFFDSCESSPLFPGDAPNTSPSCCPPNTSPACPSKKSPGCCWAAPGPPRSSSKRLPIPLPPPMVSLGLLQSSTPFFSRLVRTNCPQLKQIEGWPPSSLIVRTVEPQLGHGAATVFKDCQI